MHDYWMLFRFARPWSCRAEGIVTKYEYLTVLQDLTRKRDALIEAVDSLYYAIQIGAITDAPEIPQRAETPGQRETENVTKENL